MGGGGCNCCREASCCCCCCVDVLAVVVAPVFRKLCKVSCAAWPWPRGSACSCWDGNLAPLPCSAATPADGSSALLRRAAASSSKRASCASRSALFRSKASFSASARCLASLAARSCIIILGPRIPDGELVGAGPAVGRRGAVVLWLVRAPGGTPLVAAMRSAMSADSSTTSGVNGSGCRRASSAKRTALWVFLETRTARCGRG